MVGYNVLHQIILRLMLSMAAVTSLMEERRFPRRTIRLTDFILITFYLFNILILVF